MYTIQIVHSLEINSILDFFNEQSFSCRRKCCCRLRKEAFCPALHGFPSPNVLKILDAAEAEALALLQLPAGDRARRRDSGIIHQFVMSDDDEFRFINQSLSPIDASLSVASCHIPDDHPLDDPPRILSRHISDPSKPSNPSNLFSLEVCDPKVRSVI